MFYSPTEIVLLWKCYTHLKLLIGKFVVGLKSFSLVFETNKNLITLADNGWTHSTHKFCYTIWQCNYKRYTNVIIKLTACNKKILNNVMGIASNRLETITFETVKQFIFCQFW